MTQENSLYQNLLHTLNEPRCHLFDRGGLQHLFFSTTKPSKLSTQSVVSLNYNFSPFFSLLSLISYNCRISPFARHKVNTSQVRRASAGAGSFQNCLEKVLHFADGPLIVLLLPQLLALKSLLLMPLDNPYFTILGREQCNREL